MTIFSPGAGHDAGEIVFVPRGYIHHIENIYEGKLNLPFLLIMKDQKMLEFQDLLVPIQMRF
jgi:oxalate decarboxylase/phosphoglucose isomerase-like protein (cupin superfamily)